MVASGMPPGAWYRHYHAQLYKTYRLLVLNLL